MASNYSQNSNDVVNGYNEPPSVYIQNSRGSISTASQGYHSNTVSPMSGTVYSPTLETAMTGINFLPPPMELIITEQPTKRMRFRYPTELSGSKGNKSLLKVMVNNYQHYNVVEASMVAVAVTDEKPPGLHVNRLFGRGCHSSGPYRGCYVAQIDKNGIAQFPQFGVMRIADREFLEYLKDNYIAQWERENPGQPVPEKIKQEKHSLAMLNEATVKPQRAEKVCLALHATIQTLEGPIRLQPIITDTIVNSHNPKFCAIKIAEMDKYNGSCKGNEKVWLRTNDKIDASSIKIKFWEPETPWSSYAPFNTSDVHGQVLIIFSTPRYIDISIDQPKRVFVCLERLAHDEATSDPVEFFYQPDPNSPRIARPQPVMLGDGQFPFMRDGNYFGTFQSPIAPSAPHQAGSYAPSQFQGGNYNYQARHQSPNKLKVEPESSKDSGFMSGEQSESRNDDARIVAEVIVEEAPLGRQLQSFLNDLHLGLQFLATDGNAEQLVKPISDLIKTANKDGDNFLHLCIKHGQTERLTDFLYPIRNTETCGIAVNHLNSDWQTPLHLALIKENEEAVRELMAHQCKRSILTKDGNSVVHLLARCFNREIMRLILRHPAEFYTTHDKLDLNLTNHHGMAALHDAVTQKNEMAVRALIDAGVNLNTPDRNSGKCAIHFAVANCSDDLVDIFLKAKCDVNSQCGDGSTALHMAIEMGNVDLVRKLMTAGADPMLLHGRSSAVRSSYFRPDDSAFDVSASSNMITSLGVGKMELENDMETNKVTILSMPTRLEIAEVYDENENWKSLLYHLGRLEKITLIKSKKNELTEEIKAILRTAGDPVDDLNISHTMILFTEIEDVTVSNLIAAMTVEKERLKNRIEAERAERIHLTGKTGIVC